MYDCGIQTSNFNLIPTNVEWLHVFFFRSFFKYSYKCLYFTWAHSLWLNNIIKETLRQIHELYAIGFVKKKLSQILIFECNQINGQVYAINCFRSKLKWFCSFWKYFCNVFFFFFCFSIHFGNAESVPHESFITCIFLL